MHGSMHSDFATGTKALDALQAFNRADETARVARRSKAFETLQEAKSTSDPNEARLLEAMKTLHITKRENDPGPRVFEAFKIMQEVQSASNPDVARLLEAMKSIQVGKSVARRPSEDMKIMHDAKRSNNPDIARVYKAYDTLRGFDLSGFFPVNNSDQPYISGQSSEEDDVSDPYHEEFDE